MFKAIKEFFFGKPAEVAKVEEAPYKIETPNPALIISQAPETAAYIPDSVNEQITDAKSEVAVDVATEVIAETAVATEASASVEKVQKERAKKPAAAKPVAAKKPAAPRKPRAKKTTA